MSLTDLLNQAQHLANQGRTEDAIGLYRSWLETSPPHMRFVALFNLGTLLGATRRHEEAVAVYRDALALKPDFFQARLNLGHQLEQQGRAEDALVHWGQAVSEMEAAGRPDKSLASHGMNNIARVLEQLRRFDEAEAAMKSSLAIDPEQPAVLQHYIHIRQKQCEWPVFQPLPGASLNQQLLATSPLAMLSATDDPALQLLSGLGFVRSKVKPAEPRPQPAAREGRRIRIGYLSGDLCLHAVGLLTVELFELHDRERFEVFGFCWSREDGTPLRQRIVAAFDHHIRIGAIDDAAAAQLIRSHGIDVLVDLQGLTSGARPDILSHRPAPLQLTYLGFPGPTALPGIDYVICDDFVYPPELEPYMTEKPLRLKQCFQSSDRQRLASPAPTRADCGLPEDAFVFCSFNNNFKFTPELFAVWMRILQQVPGSVLWLLADNRWAQDNMLASATAHGVDPARLLFAPRAVPRDYLARLTLVDLCLDTFPYNAGTTANDVLFMGTPILTCSGKTFVSRMAGSLLHAVGLPDLVTTSFEEYERKAVQLGRNPRMVATYKRYLQEHRQASALFDMPGLVRDLEQQMTRLLGEAAGAGAAA